IRLAAPAFLLAPCLEYRQLLAVPAGAHENLPFAFSAQLHLLAALRAARVRLPGDMLAMAAFAVLADEHLPSLAVHFQHRLAAVGAGGAGDIVMLERLAACLDFRHDSPR